jgi:SAM-dependent methyltransferase
MSVLNSLHGGIVHTRRVRVLSLGLAPLFPRGAKVLDVGCGDGLIAKLIGEQRPDLTLEGIDVLVRPHTHVPVRAFDGRHIDAADNSYDAVLFVDVLHHTQDPSILLREAARVARQCVILKDHTRDGFLAGPTLAFMDWVGNARHGVALPYNYWPRQRWLSTAADLGLTIARWDDRLQLYPWWARWVFERKLHFVARMEVPATPTAAA